MTRNQGVNFYYKGEYIGFILVSNANEGSKIKQAFCMVEEVQMYRDSLFIKIYKQGGLEKTDPLFNYYQQWRNIKLGA